MMEMVEEVVIVGAGIGGLATSLGLHRLGIRSLVLESSASLRATGFAFTTWANAWRALDALGIGDSLRQHHNQLLGMAATSSNTGLAMAEMSFKTEEANGGHEVRCMKRNMLLETLERELPHGTVRYSSKVVSVEDSGYFKLVHIADGSVIKTKVLIGCDGVNSAVAQWLGLKKPAFAGRSAIRGQTIYKGNHGFESKFYQFFGDGVRSGFIPSDDDVVYWFLTFSPSSKGYKNTRYHERSIMKSLHEESPPLDYITPQVNAENSCGVFCVTHMKTLREFAIPETIRIMHQTE
nr:zeaxanthin epoxidase [Camellia sinensis]